jgi:hypothetical protein
VSEPRPLGHLVAALAPHADVASMTTILTATLADVLPKDLVRVEYRRSLGDKLAGRVGDPVAVSVGTGDRELTLRADARGGTEATIAHIVRGVVLSRSPVSIPEWIDALAAEVDRAAARDDAARAALDRLLLG